MKRPPRGIGGAREVYSGTRHTGTVKVLADGYRAVSVHSAKPLGTFETEAAANHAIFDADCAHQVEASR